jgi:hypothetical protein
VRDVGYRASNIYESFPAGDSQVTVGHVDCSTADNINHQLCQENDVDGVPTINAYREGVKVSAVHISCFGLRGEGRAYVKILKAIFSL